MADDLEAAVADALNRLLGFNSKMQFDGADLTMVQRLAAAIDSANYMNECMKGAERTTHPEALLRVGLASRSIADGLCLEFGVFSGTTINCIAKFESGEIFGFDSFEGLPEDWRQDIKRGAFKLKALPEVPANVKLVVGWFEKTLPSFVESHPGPVSFLHVDCDLYSSTKTVFHYLRNRIVPGTVIVFDEYFNYVGWRNHEFKAFKEFVTEASLSYRYIAVCTARQQVAVKIV